jgi:hypothetical protein
MEAPSRPTGLVFLGCGIAFLAIALGSRQHAFLGVGMAFLALGIVFLARGRHRP